MLSSVEAVVKKAIQAGSLEEAASIFEGLDPDSFMSLDHVERLYRLVGFMYKVLRERALEAVRVGDYIVVMPDPRSPGVSKNASQLERRVVDAALATNIDYEDLLLPADYSPLAAYFQEEFDGGFFEEAPVLPTGVIRFYTAFRLEAPIEGDVPVSLAYFPAAVIGVDSDTGRLFVNTLPPGTGLAALIVEKELKEGLVDAVRAIMGYDRELWEQERTLGSVVRLQGDLYLRLHAYTREPRELARRLTAAWYAASHAVRELDGLASEVHASYKRELEGLAGSAGHGGRHLRLRAAMRALEASLVRRYPWIVEDLECVYAGECNVFWDSADSGLFSPDNTDTVKVSVVRVGELRRSTVNTRPHPPETIDFYETPIGFEAIIAAYKQLTILEVETDDLLSNVIASLSNPAWAVALLLSLDMLNLLPHVQQDLSTELLVDALSLYVRAMMPGPLRELDNVNAIPHALAYAAAIKALRGGGAPEVVASAVEEAGTASIIEARVGDHLVTLEGYLLEGPTRDGIIIGELLADMMTLRVAIEGYEGEERPLKALAENNGVDAGAKRLSAARSISRLFKAKDSLLAAVTADGPGEIEAKHPEHGVDKLELPKPALITVTNNPSVMYQVPTLSKEEIPSYLRERI